MTTVTSMASTATTVSTTTTTGEETVIEGSLYLFVQDHTAFITDTVALEAVAAGIASAIGVDKQFITVIPRLRRLNQGRKLASGTVKIDYIVKIPGGSVADVSAVVETISTVTANQLSKSIAAKILVRKGLGYAIVVTSKTMPSVNGSPVTRTTTMALTPTTLIPESPNTSLTARATCRDIMTGFWILLCVCWIQGP